MRGVWGALVAVAAVFLLNGAPCTGHDQRPETGQDAATSLTAAASVHHSPLVGGASASSPAAERGGPGSEGTQQPDRSTGELMAVCIAVLSAGLALLVPLLLRREPLSGQSWFRAYSQHWTSAPALPRPPDLFALCVLRN